MSMRLRGALCVLIGQAAQSISTFLTGLMVARWGGLDELGYYAIAYSFCFLGVCLGDALLATPYTYFHSKAPERREGMLRAVFSGSLVLAVLLGACVPLLAFAGVDSLGSVVATLPLALLLVVLREMFRRHWYVAGHWTRAFFTDAASALLQLAFVLALGLADSLTAATAYLAIALAVLMPVAVFSRDMAWGSGAWWGRETWHWLTQYFLYGRWLVVGSACHVASVQLYPWLALLGAGASGTGLFAACMALANLLNPLLIGLTNYFRPRLMARHSSMPSSAFSRYVGKVALLFMGPSLVFALVALFLGGELLEVLYGSEFREGGTALFYLVVAGVFIALAAPLQLALLAARVPASNLFHHATALLILAVAGVLMRDALLLENLAYIYAGVNFAGLLVLLLFFWSRVVRG